MTDIETDRQNQSYVHEDEGNQEEIDFDQLLGDAAQTQVDSEEDRDDYDFDEEDSNADSFALSNTDKSVLKAEIQEEAKRPQDDREAQMWDYVIEKHGRKEF